MTSSRVIGPALAGLLVVTAGFGWAFLVDGLTYTAVLVGLWLIRTDELHRAPVAPKRKGQVREGLRYARSVPDLWVPLLMMAVVGTLSYNFQVVFPLFTTRDLGGDASTFTWLFSVVSVGALVGALATARRKVIDIRVVSTSSIAYGIGLLLMTFAPSTAFAFPLGLLVGLGSIAFLTASTAIVQIQAAAEFRGRILALQAMVFLGSTPIGGPIVGWISEQFGARYAIAVGAAAALGAGLWGLSFVRDRRGRLTADQAQESVNDAVADLDREGEVPAVA
jgi:predicted MFS family arabinose efflux permease